MPIAVGDFGLVPRPTLLHQNPKRFLSSATCSDGRVASANPDCRIGSTPSVPPGHGHHIPATIIPHYPAALQRLPPTSL